jgi:hypothetical protein
MTGDLRRAGEDARTRLHGAVVDGPSIESSTVVTIRVYQ